MQIESWMEIAADAAADCLKMLPFLLAAFLLVEWAEHRAGDRLGHILQRTGRIGPLAGALCGCLPQCGFSVLAANLYAAGLVTAGTLLAVFISTSDEAVILLLAEPDCLPVIGKLIVCKILIAAAAGFLADGVFFRPGSGAKKDIHDLCHHCGCGSDRGILRPALRHTVRLFLYLLIVTLAFNALMSFGGEELIHGLFLKDSILQPFLTALVGLIPNCASSVILTRLYLEGAIRFGSVMAGLVSGAGVGLLVLFRTNRNRGENLRLLAFLYLTAVLSGIILL